MSHTIACYAVQNQTTEDIVKSGKSDAEREINEKVADAYADEMRTKGLDYVEANENRSKMQEKLTEAIRAEYNRMTKAEQRASELQNADGKFDERKAGDRADESMEKFSGGE